MYWDNIKSAKMYSPNSNSSVVYQPNLASEQEVKKKVNLFWVLLG